MADGVCWGWGWELGLGGGGGDGLGVSFEINITQLVLGTLHVLTLYTAYGIKLI